MDTEQTLRQIVADLMQADASQLRAETRLAGGRMTGSLGRAILESAIRQKLGVKNVNCMQVKTFGELQALVTGQPMSQTPSTQSAPAASPLSASGVSNVACGIDMEMVDALPVETDYWQSDFYRTHFTHAEIAYCLTQPEPRPHFAARWCAKEAIKKCDAMYLSVEFTAMEVVVDGAGKPSLRARLGDDWTVLPHAVSLTHTAVVAAAVVVSAAPATTPTPNHNGSPAPAAQPRGIFGKLLGR
jgi:phosphopantetheine--protein transferase-like protein